MPLQIPRKITGSEHPGNNFGTPQSLILSTQYLIHQDTITPALKFLAQTHLFKTIRKSFRSMCYDISLQIILVHKAKGQKNPG